MMVQAKKAHGKSRGGGARVASTKVVTIHDVARHAGVSSMTVSRVINQSANVRPHLRDKVLASVKALDYRTNLAARSTRSGLGGIRIGIL